jgi:hypothetical protein
MPNEERPIKMPAGYAPAQAVGYADASGRIILVDSNNPLPITTVGNAAPPVEVPPPLEGIASTAQIIGPFAPIADRSVVLTLSGTWEGSVQLMRSVDRGATMHKVTAGGAEWGHYTGNACEPVWQESMAGAQLYLDVVLQSGTLAYQVAQ